MATTTPHPPSDEPEAFALSRSAIASLAALFLAAASFVAFRVEFLQLRSRSRGDPIEGLLFSPEETSPQLLYGLCALVLWTRRRQIAQVLGVAQLLVPGSLVLLAGIALFVWGHGVGQFDLYADSLLLCGLGGALMLGGTRLVTVLAVPLFLVWLARPWSPLTLLYLLPLLQELTAIVAAGLIDVFSDSVDRFGTFIRYDDRLFEVIATCSGLRIIQTLLMSAVVYGEFFGLSRARTLLLLGVAPLIGFVVNALRVISIVLSPWADIQPLHSGQGIVMIIIAVLLLHAVAVLSRRLGGDRRPLPSPSSPAALPLGSLGLVCLVAGLLAVGSFAPIGTTRAETRKWPLHRIPENPGEWTSQASLLDTNFFGPVRFTNQYLRSYERDGEVVSVLVGENDRRRRDRVGLTPLVRLPGAGWWEFQSSIASLRGIEAPVERVVSRRGGQEAVVYTWRIGAESILEEWIRWRLALDLWPGLYTEPIVTFQVSAIAGAAGLGATDRAVVELLEELAGSLPPRDPSES